MYLGLGSNVGDSERLLASAVSRLRELLRSARVSSVYRTTPRYVLDQPDFLNLVVAGDTDLGPMELLERTQAMEAEFGRDRSKERHKGPRTLDIDILLHGSTTMRSSALTLPHPGIAERAFVLVPLLELEPDLRHPVSGVLLSSFLQSVGGQGIYLHAKAPL